MAGIVSAFRACGAGAGREIAALIGGLVSAAERVGADREGVRAMGMWRGR